MISDVLFEALEEIARYRKEFPSCYDDCDPMLDHLCKVMADVQAYFDSPVKPDCFPPSTEVVSADRQKLSGKAAGE
jgi:hypothetical protein